MIGIYKITSPSGKVYIGQSIDIKYRFITYRRLRCKSQTRLYYSFIKHGVENHLFEVVCECKPEQLCELERHYQDFYNTIGSNGLNCIAKSTNDKSPYISEETRKRLRDSHVGYVLTEEHRMKISNAHKGKKVHPNYLNGVKKPVYCFALDGDFIARYDSIRDAANATGTNEKALARCASGHYKTAGGFLWSKTQNPPKYEKIVTKSGYIGVVRSGKKWIVVIKNNQKVRYAGTYMTPHEAALARNQYIIDNNLNLKLNDIPEYVKTCSKIVKDGSSSGYKHIYRKRDKWGYEIKASGERHRKYGYYNIMDAIIALNEVIIKNGFNIQTIGINSTCSNS